MVESRWSAVWRCYECAGSSSKERQSVALHNQTWSSDSIPCTPIRHHTLSSNQTVEFWFEFVPRKFRMSQPGQDAKFFQRGKIEVLHSWMAHFCRLPCNQELRSELQAAEAKDKKYVKRKTVLKRIVANITMGNDSERSNAIRVYS